MTGEGTQESPYLVETWAELLSVATSSNVYIEAANEQNIDFNTIAPDGYNSTITLRGKDINLNGWTLSNFHSTAQYAIRVYSNCTFSNLIFENFYHQCDFDSTTKASFFVDNSGLNTITFKNCYFRGREVYGDSNSFFALSSNSGGYQYVFNQCVFIIKGTANCSYTLIKGKCLLSCNSLLDIQAGVVKLFSEIDSFDRSYSLSCKYTGAIKWTSTRDSGIGSAWKEGVYINPSNGSEVSHSDYTTYKCEVNMGQKYMLDININNNALMDITFFDENNNFISGFSGRYNSYYSFYAPHNAKYLYISKQKTTTILGILSFPKGTISYSGNKFICGSSHSGWNIYNLDLNETCRYAYSGVQMSIYNKDKFNHESVNSQLTGCTDAQIYDADYLSSIGFPIDDESTTVVSG